MAFFGGGEDPFGGLGDAGIGGGFALPQQAGFQGGGLGGFWAGGADPFGGGGPGVGQGFVDPGVRLGFQAGGADPFGGVGAIGPIMNPVGGLQAAFAQRALAQRMALPTNYGNNAVRFGNPGGYYGGGGGGGGGGYYPGQRGGNDYGGYSVMRPQAQQQGYGYYGGGGAGGNAMAQQLLTQFQGAHEAAKAANLQRYGDILAGYQSRYKRGMDLLDKTSGQERKDINAQYDRANADTIQSATDRGLGNTTILDSLQRGVGEDRAKALNRQSDQEAQRKLTADMQLDQDTLAFKERRTDSYPSYELMASLASQAGQGGGGGGMGGGGAGGAGGGGYGGGGGVGGINPASYDPKGALSVNAMTLNQPGGPTVNWASYNADRWKAQMAQNAAVWGGGKTAAAKNYNTSYNIRNNWNQGHTYSYGQLSDPTRYGLNTSDPTVAKELAEFNSGYGRNRPANTGAAIVASIRARNAARGAPNMAGRPYAGATAFG